MDPNDKLEKDFRLYRSFFKRNLQKLRDEKDKALSQEWLRRLESMRETRAEKRDSNVYLSQLVLTMGDGKLAPPFNTPPPHHPLPRPVSLLGDPQHSREVSQHSMTTHKQSNTLGTTTYTRAEQLSSTNYEDVEILWSNETMFPSEVFESLNHQSPLLEIPVLYTTFDNSTEQLSDNSSNGDNNKWANDIIFSADEHVSKYSRSLHSEDILSISSREKIIERWVKRRILANKPLHRTWLAAGQFVTKSSHTLQPVDILSISSRDKIIERWVERRMLANKPLHRESLVGGQFVSKKRQMLPLTPGPSSSIVDIIQPKRKTRRSADIPRRPDSVLSLPDNDGRHSTNLSRSRVNVFSKPKKNLDMHRAIVSRTCPHPSLLPLVEEGQPYLRDDSLSASIWAEIVTQDMDGNSLESLLSYSKGRWLEESRDDESLMPEFSDHTVTSTSQNESIPQSGTSASSGENIHQVDLAPTHSKPSQFTTPIETEVQSVSCRTLESRQITPATSSSSVFSRGQQQNSTTPPLQSEQDQFSTTPETQPVIHLPQEEITQRQSSPTPPVQSEQGQFSTTSTTQWTDMFLSGVLVSTDEVAYYVYTPTLPSPIHEYEAAIPAVIKFAGTRKQIEQQRLSKSSKANTT